MFADGSGREPKAQVPMVGGRGITLEFCGPKVLILPVFGLINRSQNIINFSDPM